MTYRYYTPCRPAEPGSVPREGLVRVVHADDEDMLIDEEGHLHRAWSLVEYNRKLTQKEIDDYELDED